MGRKWALALTITLVAALMAGSGVGYAAEGEEEGGGNNLSTPVFFAEGYGLSGIQVDPADITSTGMPGLLKPVCVGEEYWDAGSDSVAFPSAEPDFDYALDINGTTYDQQDGTGTADAGPYFLQPYSLVPLAGGDADPFGQETCWEAKWVDGSVIDTVEADSVDVGDSLVRTLRSEGPNPIRVEFSLFQTATSTGIFQDGTELSGYPMTQLWPPAFADGKPPSVGEGERIEVWATADDGGTGAFLPAEEATVFTQNARLTIDKLTWAVLPDTFADGNLEGYPSGVIPGTFEEGYEDWVASVQFDGVVGGGEGEGGFSAEVNQGGRLLYGYNWKTAESGWYRLTLSIDGEANQIAANAVITGVNEDDTLADAESEGGSSGSSKAFFPPTFVEDTDGNYLFVDVYVAPKPSVGNGNMNGKVTKPGGSPLGNKTVTVYDPSGTPVGMTTTGSDGLYGMDILPGTYNVGFSDPNGVYFPEFWDDQASLAEADDVVLNSGQSRTLNAELSAVAPPGSGRIRGTVENTAGDPLKGITVTAYNPAGNPAAVTTSDASGAFAMVLVEGTYNVGFSDSGGVYGPEYFDDRTTLAEADDITVTEGKATSIAAALAKGAVIRGTVRGEFLNDLIPGATVTATTTDGTTVGAAKTGEDGRFSLTLPGGNFKFRIAAPGHLSEWWDNEASLADADVVTVAPEEVVTMDVRLLPASFFTDVDPDSVFVGDIQWLKDSGITKGCNPPDNDRFCPKDPVTRAQMASFLVRALGLTEGGDVDRFVDDDGSVHETDINRLAAAGITKGCNPPDNTRYCPDDPVTRAQMASFLVRALGLTEGGDVDRFVDDDGSVHETDINRLATADITRGCNPPDNTRYCPTADVLREQMAAFLHRAFD